MGELLTLKEVARLLKIEVETVRRNWILAGILPANKDTGKWLIDADDLPAAIAEKSRRAEDRKALKLKGPEKPEGHDSFSDLNATIAKAGECTRASEKDQLHRETRDREWTPPEIPE